MSRAVASWFARIALAATVAVVSGCAGEPGGTETASAPASGAPPVPPPVNPNAPPVPPPAPAASQAEKPQLRRVIGQTTTDVQDFDAAMQTGENVRVSDGKISPNNTMITYSGNAYVSIVGQAAVLQIEHAVNIFNALNDRYPADTEEFMREIIQANGIRLPQLPGYQEYAYKPDTHELIVLEYPDRKEALRAQVRGDQH